VVAVVVVVVVAVVVVVVGQIWRNFMGQALYGILVDGVIV